MYLLNFIKLNNAFYIINKFTLLLIFQRNIIEFVKIVVK